MYRTLALLLGLTLVPSIAQAGLVVGFDIKEAPEIVNGDSVTGSGFIRGNASAAPGSDFATAGWIDTSYLQFGFTSTKNWDLTAVRFELELAGPQAPSIFKLQADVGGGFSDVTPSQLLDTNSTFVANFTNVSSMAGVNDVQFRLIATNALSTVTSEAASVVFLKNLDDGSLGHGTAVDFAVEGNLSAVPEPSSLVLLGAGLVGAACRRRRR